jgi:hypothetical protein
MPISTKKLGMIPTTIVPSIVTVVTHNSQRKKEKYYSKRNIRITHEALVINRT